MSIKVGRRHLIVGPTGCGKTVLSKELCIEYCNRLKNHKLYIFNSKCGDDFKSWGNEILNKGYCPNPLKRNERLQIWSPIHRYPDQIEKWLDRVLNSGPNVLLIDEIIHMMYGRHISEKYEEIQKTGRSKGISLISNTQNLVKLDPIIVSQSSDFYRFRLLNPYERRLSQMLLKSEQKIEEPQKYGFYYTSLDDMEPYSYYKDYKQLLREL